MDQIELDIFRPAAKLGATFIPAYDQARLASALARVIALMVDGGWHTCADLRRVGGSSGDRRLRELRDAAFGGVQIECCRDLAAPASGQWFYRLAPSTTQDQMDRLVLYLNTHTEAPDADAT